MESFSHHHLSEINICVQSIAGKQNLIFVLLQAFMVCKYGLMKSIIFVRLGAYIWCIYYTENKYKN